jgi:hypothetical protein
LERRDGKEHVAWSYAGSLEIKNAVALN